jgi:hypothetical protein
VSDESPIIKAIMDDGHVMFGSKCAKCKKEWPCDDIVAARKEAGPVRRTERPRKPEEPRRFY